MPDVTRRVGRDGAEEEEEKQVTEAVVAVVKEDLMEGKEVVKAVLAKVVRPVTRCVVCRIYKSFFCSLKKDYKRLVSPWHPTLQVGSLVEGDSLIDFPTGEAFSNPED
jgi:hypothetical protein